MANSAPGKSYRDGKSLIDLFDKFPTDEAEREWFEGLFWPSGAFFPRCGSKNVVKSSTHP